jgi:tripeptidyl-peptidase-1
MLLLCSYLNILFYQNPTIFTDITSGNNPGCGTKGFYAAKGWDPITGLGSPQYQKLVNLALSLP